MPDYIEYPTASPPADGDSVTFRTGTLPLTRTGIAAGGLTLREVGTAEAGTITAALAAPVISGVPTISGTTTEGETLTATAATVTGNPTPTRTWQWERGGVAIAGATGATYVLQAADVGATLTVVQTETNSEGPDTAESAATATIAAAGASTPATILGADVVQWLDPQSTATMFNTIAGTGAISTDGDLVGRIVGQEGATAFNATADSAARPVYRTANGGYLEGALGNSNALAASVSSSGAFYLAARMRIRSIAASSAVKLFTLHSTAGGLWWQGSNASIIVNNFGAIRVAQDGGGPATGDLTANTWFTFEAIFDTDSRVYAVDGVDGTEETGTYTPPTTTLLTLLAEPGGDGGNIDIGRFVLGAAVPSAGQRTDLRAWLES